MELWRYVEFNELIILLEKESLILKYPGLWPDKLERIITEMGEKQPNLLENKFLKCWGEAESTMSICTSELFKARCLCFTLCPEDPKLLFEHYKKSDILIKFRFDEDIANKIVEVNYVDVDEHEFLECILNKANKDDGFSIRTLLSTKISKYTYEHEYRYISSIETLTENRAINSRKKTYWKVEILHRYGYLNGGEFISQGVKYQKNLTEGFSILKKIDLSNVIEISFPNEKYKNCLELINLIKEKNPNCLVNSYSCSVKFDKKII